MAIEIERKFLVINDDWRKQAVSSSRMVQGYLANNADTSSVRVRIDGDQANLNIKSGRISIRRMEYEYPVPLEDAQYMLENMVTGPVIDKMRYFIPYAGHTWEVDEFYGNNEGLVVAEVELASEEQVFEKPAWIGDEVSHDPRYYNVNLVSHPYRGW